MKTALLLFLAFAVVAPQSCPAAEAAFQIAKPAPSPIPENLMAEAKQAFAKKLLYFIWTEEKAPKSNSVPLKFAVNPAMKEEPAVTVAVFFYTQIETVLKDGSKRRQRARVTSTGEGIRGAIANEFGAKGAEDVTYYLIKASDAQRIDWSMPNRPRLVPISNALTVKVSFEAGGGREMLQVRVMDVGEPEPSTIPLRLQAEAKKAFARKMAYFIWTEEKGAKAKDFQLKYLANPDLAEVPAFTVAKFTYTAAPDFVAKQGKRVPFTSTGEGINGMIPQAPDGKFKGTTDVTFYLVKASDAMKPDRTPNPNLDKAPPISNTITVKLTFE